MKKTYTEYNATSSATSCYSNLNSYGTYPGRPVNRIINPTPATAVPQIYYRLKPSQPPHRLARNQTSKSLSSCPPYDNLNILS
jgi:hypothetical protein